MSQITQLPRSRLCHVVAREVDWPCLSRFPETTFWNLSVNLAICWRSDRRDGRANRSILASAAQGEDAGTEGVFTAWCALAIAWSHSGRPMCPRGPGRSERGGEISRAVIYYMTGRGMQSRHFAPRRDAYRQHAGSAMTARCRAGRAQLRAREIPYDDTVFPGTVSCGAWALVRARACSLQRARQRERMIYWSGIGSPEPARHLDSVIDHPGVGEALRLRGHARCLGKRKLAGAALDLLEPARNVQPDRIGMMGWSLGGYYARAQPPRAPLQAVRRWGANHNWGELQRLRLAREGDRPVPHYWITC